MKLTTLAEVTRHPPAGATFPPTEILVAAFAAISVRGKYISTTENPAISTGADVRRMLWGTGRGDDQATETQISNAMSDPQVVKQANDAFAWFQSIPAAEKQKNDFYSTIANILSKGNVSERQVGFVAAIATAYMRSATYTRPGDKFSAEWDSKWGDEVEVIYKQPVRVRDSVTRTSQTTQLPFHKVTIELPSGHLATWFIRGSQEAPKVGQTLTVTGFLEPDARRMTSGGASAPGIKFTPDRRIAPTGSADSDSVNDGEDSDTEK